MIKRTLLFVFLGWALFSCEEELSSLEELGNVVDTILIDSIIMDTIIVDSILYDTLLTDSIIFDTTFIDSIVIDTILIDSIVIDTIEFIDTIEIITYNIGGYIQKGPYINGTSIVINELKKDLSQTGNYYSAQILDNKGTFELNNVELKSNYVELKADGFYFNEVANETSSAQLTLYALSNIKDKTTLNANVLSYLEKGRLEYLFSGGVDFESAKKQAQKEVLEIFSFNNTIPNSELLDISNQGDENAILLAISVILQGYLSEAELSELLANISTDIRTDGTLNSQTLGSQLMNTATKLNLQEIRNNIEGRYESLGMNVTVADFEKFVNYFIDNSSFEQTEKIEYLENGDYGANILHENTTYCPKGDYSMAASLPEGYSLKVVMVGDNFGYYYGQHDPGWVKENYNSTTNTSTFVSTRSGEIDLKMSSNLNEYTAPILLEVYENGAVNPTFSKKLYYNSDDEVAYPVDGAWGKNILAMQDSTKLDTNATFSLTADLPNDKEYSIVINLNFNNENSYIVDSINSTNWEVFEYPSNLQLKARGKGIKADLPIEFKNSDYLYIDGSVVIHGLNW